MNGELEHREASELLGAYALDALDLDERDAVEAHMAGCGWCQAEFTEHREVAALLSSGVAVPPLGLWDRISSAMEEAPPPLDLSVVTAISPRHADAVPSNSLVRHRRRPRSSAQRDRRTVSMSARFVAAMSVAAVALFGVAGLVATGVLDDGPTAEQVALPHGQELQRTIAAAMADPAATKVSLRSGDGLLFADAWMLPDGRGYLVSNNLRPLASDRTYQLWALEGIDKISVGLLGPSPDATAFRATGPVTALAITEETGRGASQPTGDPLVVGNLA